MINTLLLRIIFLIFLSYFIFGCGGGQHVPLTGPAANNIILLIGDGMGAEHRKAARWISAGETGKLSMDDMPVTGSLQTHSADSSITDSAAAATAMASGVKTNRGVIGLDARLSFVSTILEDAKNANKFVGLVTTTHISHATPAAFVSHLEDRDLLNDIAEQIVNAGVNVLLGGGEDEFFPASENGCFPESGGRTDGRNLIDKFIADGYVYTCDPVAFGFIEPASTSRLAGFFADDGMKRPFSPTLADMTQKAIDVLSRNEDGFFLMVEGGQIDWASHDNDAGNAISDTLGFDEAVEVAKRFASKTDDTLIIVTADHETGGMVVSLSPTGLPGEDGPFSMPDGKQFYINWSTKKHTEMNVPVTSQGPLSDMLMGVHDNTYIHEVMQRAFGGD
jgi:alkaline phosphatase